MLTDTDKLARLVAIQQAALGAEVTYMYRLEKHEEHLAVIATALQEALAEINKISVATEGKEECDIWYHILHNQALLAWVYVDSKYKREESYTLSNRMFKRSQKDL